jgi:hypothetical protein
MIEMELRDRFSVRAFRTHPIGIVAQHEPRQAVHAILGVNAQQESRLGHV